jgi:hypothetical protein
MKLLCLPLFLTLLLRTAIPVADPIDKIAGLIKQGNIPGLSKMFAQDIEVSILDDENVYSKAQAGIILDKFFSQNKAKTVKALHKVNSNPNYHFGVLIMTTEKGTYRISCTLKGSDGALMLIALRIEKEKVR